MKNDLESLDDAEYIITDNATERWNTLMNTDQQRLLQRLILCKDCSFGTLWWVANTIWMRNRSLRFQNISGTHPGVSVAASWPHGNPDKVSMLFGTSRKTSQAFIARVKPNQLSYFPCMKPIKMRAADFFGGSAVEASPKRRLDADETKRLKAFIGEKLQ